MTESQFKTFVESIYASRPPEVLGAEMLTHAIDNHLPRITDLAFHEERLRASLAAAMDCHLEASRR